MASVNALDWTLLAEAEVAVGDLVSADAGGMPIYRVVAVEGGQAWLRGEPDRTAAQVVMPLGRLRWRAAAHRA